MTDKIITAINTTCYKKGGVYLISCTMNGKGYCGSSHAINGRRKEHLNGLKIGKHYNKALQEDFSQYGENAFTIEILYQGADTIDRLNVEAKNIKELMKTGKNYNQFKNREWAKPFNKEEITAALNREKEIKRRKFLKLRRF